MSSSTTRWKRRQFKKKKAQKCAYCGWPLTLETATVDHVHPRSRGGANAASNYVLACRKCNEEKDDKVTVWPAAARSHAAPAVAKSGGREVWIDNE